MEIPNSSIVSGGMNKYDIFHLTYISTRALSFVEWIVKWFAYSRNIPVIEP